VPGCSCWSGSRRSLTSTPRWRLPGAGSILRITHPEFTVVHRPDRSSSSSSLEDGVLDRLQPDVDPRLVELVNELPPEDRKIALLKIAADCSWAAAANYGQTDRRAETIRRRLDRHRQALNPTVT
jgi:hypothetical protein